MTQHHVGKILAAIRLCSDIITAAEAEHQILTSVRAKTIASSKAVRSFFA